MEKKKKNQSPSLLLSACPISCLGLTVPEAHGFEGGAGLHRVGRVDEVERGAEDPRQDAGQLPPGTVHTAGQQGGSFTHTAAQQGIHSHTGQLSLATELAAPCITCYYLLCHAVLEPHPELCPRGGRQERLAPLRGPPEALCEGDVQLPHRELGDDLAQGLGEQPVVRHWNTVAE